MAPDVPAGTATPEVRCAMSTQALQLIVSVVSVLLIIFSASLHEFGHAYAAHLCGDDTAKEQGRLTINPLAHIDPFGSVVLPLILVLSGFGYMAYAKPVPYNPYRLKNPARDEMLVALAGPLCNLIQAAVGSVLFHLALLLLYGDTHNFFYFYFVGSELDAWIPLILQLYVQINCSLAVFNLLPIPPLDGSKIISPLFKGEARNLYYKVQYYALPITMALIWLVPTIFHVQN